MGEDYASQYLKVTEKLENNFRKVIAENMQKFVHIYRKFYQPH